MKTRQVYSDNFSYRDSYPLFQLERMTSFSRIGMPRVLRILAVMIVTATLVAGLALTWIPWVQTTSGYGRVTTLDPADKIQNISALVSGRVAQWYVQDGDTVAEGDPIVRIVDVDDDLVARLNTQMEAARRKYEAARESVQTAELDLARRERLVEQGLASRLEFEQARIRVQQLKVSEEGALGELNQAQVNLSRQGSQLVVAPRDGTILHVEAGDSATMVSAGQAIASFMPAEFERVVELFIEGRDIGLVWPGRKVRLEFETWPAFQFSGIPEFAVGTFAGEVSFVEPGAGVDGRFRVLVRETGPEAQCSLPADMRPGLNVAGNCGWPPENFVPLGAGSRGWILLDRVPLGYELWRLMNNFPPGNRSEAVSVPGGAK
jgi:multidrug resistance efflux pump